MKLKVAIIHKEQQVKARNYKVWVTRHKVKVDDGTFHIKQSRTAYLAPRPEFEALLLDNKYVLYQEDAITPLQGDWKPAKIGPKELHILVDNTLLRSFTSSLYLGSFRDCLTDMLKSWCSKSTFKRQLPDLVGVHSEDTRYYHRLNSGMLGLSPTSVTEADARGLTACPYCLTNRKEHAK